MVFIKCLRVSLIGTKMFKQILMGQTLRKFLKLHKTYVKLYYLGSKVVSVCGLRL